MSHEVYTPPEGPPQDPAPSLFLHLGLPGLYAFCAEHYRRLAASTVAGLFPADPAGLEEASRRQADFLAGMLGGPRLYALKHGPPRMRSRHVDFPIDEAARQEWLRCFRETLGDGSAWGLDPSQARDWLRWTERFSAWMVNRA
jgi:hemoglobin